MEFLTDLWKFMMQRKKFWLVPIVVILLLIGVLVILAEGGAILPFVYSLF